MLDTTHRAAGPANAAPPAECPTPPFDLVTVPAREGLEAVDILRLRGGVGPVLHDGSGALGFLVPPGTAASWQLPGSSCARTGGNPRPAPGRTARSGSGAPPVAGTGWLIPPARAARLTTSPEQLRAALREAARVLDALDRCCR